MKCKLKYSYKIGCDRNNRAKSWSSIFLQAIFGCKILREIYKDSLIINIDESWFSRSVKSQNSWLPKNKSSGIININSQGRWTLIWALMSDGNWICMIHYSTTTSQDFWLFLYLLKVHLNWQNNYKDKQVVVTLDNASIHSTADVKATASKFGMKIIGLPPYWPHLAPVEYVFGAIKGHIRNTSTYGIINYSKSSGKRIIKGFKELTQAKGINLWHKMVKESKLVIQEAFKIISSSSVGFTEDYYQDEEANRDEL